MRRNGVSVYVTAPNEAEAVAISRALVGERLAACVNILGPIRSLYWWDGSMHDEREVAFIAKTRASLLPKLTARVKQLHSYECPCIVATPITGGNADFVKWLFAQTSSRPKRTWTRRAFPKVGK